MQGKPQTFFQKKRSTADDHNFPREQHIFFLFDLAKTDFPADSIAYLLFFLYYLIMKKITLLICAIALSGALALTAVSCRTVKDIPEDLTASQLLQKGQTCYDNADYKSAEIYYKTTIDRYGDDTTTYIEAKYELAHLYIKKKNYDKARSALDEILELYDYAAAGTIPPAYKKLAQIEMAKIPD